MTRQDDPYRLQELAARQEKARAMGGQRLTARECIKRLLDTGTFDELSQLADFFRQTLWAVAPSRTKINCGILFMLRDA